MRELTLVIILWYSHAVPTSRFTSLGKCARDRLQSERLIGAGGGFNGSSFSEPKIIDILVQLCVNL